MAKVLINIPDEFLSKFDGFVSSQNRTRSEVIREALKSYIRKISAQQSKNASSNAKLLEEILK